MAERSLAIAERIGEDDLRVQAHLMVGNARFWVGDLERAERHLAVVEERLPADRHTSHLSGFAQDPRFTALFPAALARRLLGDGDAALRMTEKGLQEARALGHRFSEAMVLQVLGFLHFLDGRPAAAHDAARDLVALAREHGFPMYVAIGSLQLGWARARLGEVDAGLTLVVETAARMREGGTRVAGTLIGALLADAHLAAGRPEDGLIAVEEALADAAARHELAFVDELERLRGELLREAETRSERWSG
jgi:ATP/maltotriose-dependent transcriptional regulator MalT